MNPLARAILAALLAVGAFAPLVLLMITSVGGRWLYPALTPESFTAESWSSLASTGRLGAATGWSLAIGGATAALAVGLGLPLGRALARLGGWQRRIGAAAAFLPVAAPPIALATGLQLSLLSMGLGGTAGGVVVAHLVPALGYVALYFLGLFLVFDSRIEDEARSLGATRLQTWTRVLAPLLRRPVAEAFVLAFLVSWAQVPLTLLIGGGAVRTLPVEVLAFVRAGQDRYAATGALLLIVPAALAIAVGMSARRAEAAPV